MLIWTGQRKWPTTSLQIPLKLQKFFQNFEQRSLLKYNALSYIPFKQLQLNITTYIDIKNLEKLIGISKYFFLNFKIFFEKKKKKRKEEGKNCFIIF